MAGAEEIPNQPMLERVQPMLLQLEKDRDDYQPVAVSFGPYHHGDKKLAYMEGIKPEAVKLFVSSGREDKKFYHNKVVTIIHELRSCYEQTPKVKGYTDDEFAEMMLRDAALLILYMEITTDDPTKVDELMQDKVNSLVSCVGPLAYEVLPRDMVLLENQIPLRVIRVLVDARDGDGRGDELVRRSMILMFFGEYVKKASSGHELIDSPHLLDVIRRLHISGHGEPKAKTAPPTNRCVDLENGLVKLLRRKSVEKGSLKSFVTVYRAATDLKAKGIHFRPSSTQALRDVTFKHHFLYARLSIPAFTVDRETRVLFRNMIAYEMSPSSLSDCEIVAFVDLIKSLVERAEDVRELREKKILLNKLGSDQEVLDTLGDIRTHGANYAAIYKRVRDDVGAHCDSKMRTWTAELLHTNFSSPWTGFAFLAAVALLGMTIAQVYYAVHPN